MSGPLGSWIDGVAGDRWPVEDRGLAYGDGLFETLLVRKGRPRFLEAHLARLVHGCERLGIHFEALAALRAELVAAAARTPGLAILKVVLTRGSGLRRGYAPDGTERPRRWVSLWPTEPLSAEQRAGVDLGIGSLALASQPALAGIKHLNRLEQVLGAREARAAGHFDVVMRLATGEVVSGAMSNVFAVLGARVWTPPVDQAGVAGILRGVVRRECPALDLEFGERPLTLEDLRQADEVFISNARIGVVPVRRVGEHRYTMHGVALRLQAHIEALDA